MSAPIDDDQWPARRHRTLDAIADSEHRPSRPIGVTAHQVAVDTGALQAGPAAMPHVRTFHSVRPTGIDLPPVPLALSAGGWRCRSRRSPAPLVSS